jgi:hypothetical protein
MSLYPEVTLKVTHHPNGDEIPDGSGHMIHLMPDLSVIGYGFGPLVKTGGVRNGDEITFLYDQDRPDCAGSLTVTPERIDQITGCGYSGSSHRLEIPAYKKEAVKRWIEHFPKS